MAVTYRVVGLILLLTLTAGGCILDWREDRPGCERDQSPDAGPRDTVSPDSPVPDLPLPDLPAPDSRLPDLPLPDLPIPDLPLPDQPVPDLQLPDAPVPDMKPVQKLVDEHYNDFTKGELGESGAKIYVANTAKTLCDPTKTTCPGNVQLVDRLDLDLDGNLDLVFPTYGEAKAGYKTDSAIYWGPSLLKIHLLPTIGARGVATGDFDSDGYPDIFFVNGQSVNSYLYTGKGAGKYSTPASLETRNATGVSVADVNRDGYLDLVVSNQGVSGPKNADSRLFWGTAAGYDAVSFCKFLPTIGASDNTVADLDGDGQLDIVFANRADGSNYNINSFIFKGKGNKTFASPVHLPTLGASGVSVADLNKDGQLDIVFANSSNGSTHAVNSYIYWGAATGFSSKSKKLELPTLGASGVSLADLNKDGYMDIVFSNEGTGTSSQLVNSYIYWGAGTGYSTTKRQQLHTAQASGNLVADFNGDGHLDIVFANSSQGSGKKVYSYIYWGSSTGFSPTNTRDLGAFSPRHLASADPGTVQSRGINHWFTSRVRDSGVASPSYLDLSWTAKTPKKAGIRMRVRAAASTTALAKATWSSLYMNSPASISATKGQYIQYQAELTSTYHGDSPVLDKVLIEFQ